MCRRVEIGKNMAEKFNFDELSLEILRKGMEVIEGVAPFRHEGEAFRQYSENGWKLVGLAFAMRGK